MFKHLNLHAFFVAVLAACMLPLAGCNADATAQDLTGRGVDGAGSSTKPAAELEARHFNIYQQYRATFDMPRPQEARHDVDDEQPALRHAVLSNDPAASTCLPQVLRIGE